MLIFTFIILIYYMNTVKSDCGCNNFERGNIISTNVYGKCEKSSAKEFLLNFYKNGKGIYGMSEISEGTYKIGTDKPYFIVDGESPSRNTTVNKFAIDKYEISNANFNQFVIATGYKTDAEKFNNSFIFKDLLSEELQNEYNDFRVANAPWWFRIDGINWKHPNGPETDLDGLWDHPVVHVSWNDAMAYCRWKNKRLPSESEWEIACRGGKSDRLFPWGNKLLPNGEHWMNIWQGNFPLQNKKDDGYEYTCPVNKFHQNSYNLYNIVGNVWEWTSDKWNTSRVSGMNRVKKGGSYLCHQSYCYRYRCAARSYNTEDSSAGNLGFRCAKSLN